jgi:hypothetical protein
VTTQDTIIITITITITIITTITIQCLCTWCALLIRPLDAARGDGDGWRRLTPAK